MRTALVTGAARRIGRAVATHLANSGFEVAVHCHRSVAEGEALVGSLQEAGHSAFAVTGDLSDEHACQNIVAQVLTRTKHLDVLVQSASTFTEDSVMSFSYADLEGHIKVNAFAPLILARAFAGRLHGGSIIHFLDSRVVDYDAQHASYHLSKRVFDAVTRMLAVELAPDVRVNAIAPGLILPPKGLGNAYVEMRKQEVPLKRQGTLDEICLAVDFLMANGFVTGQTIFVDGGRHLKGAFYG
ncbi:MAG: SDR family oxidoreductase [Deltaproteobacteria bacterium]|nr:SDR family oxidoreductase [Deltaproteobacteria bacterium]